MSTQNGSGRPENNMEFDPFTLQYDSYEYDPYESTMQMENQANDPAWSSAYPNLDNSLDFNFGMNNNWPGAMPTWQPNNMYSVYPEGPLLPVGIDSYIPSPYTGYPVSYPPMPAQVQPGQLTALRPAGSSSEASDYPTDISTPKMSSRRAVNTRRKAKKQQKRKASSTPPAEVTLAAPLSQLIPNASDLEAQTVSFVNRGVDKRLEEVANSRFGRVPRPLNAFILYRKTYQVPARDVSEGINHKHISKTCGASWRMETPEVRERFAEFAAVEMEAHHRAFPSYRYVPRQHIGEGTALDFNDDYQ